MISEGSCDTEDWIIMLKIQCCITEINDPIFHNITVFFLYFWTNKYSLDEHKRLN